MIAKRVDTEGNKVKCFFANDTKKDSKIGFRLFFPRFGPCTRETIRAVARQSCKLAIGSSSVEESAG